MNRNQIFTTVEFLNNIIRMTIGEYYNDKFYVFDTFIIILCGTSFARIL